MRITLEMRFKAIFSLLTMFGVHAQASPAPAFHGLGTTIEEAKQPGVFGWFHLEQTGASARDRHKVLAFQPSGPRFHNDIAKSLLRAVMSRSDAEKLDGMLTQIEFADEGRIAVIAHPDAQRPVATGPTPGLLTYLGRRESWSDRLEGSVVGMRNIGTGSEAHLDIIVTPR